MPSWIDDEGYNWFGKLECKRCLGRFDTDKDGEVPVHKCIGGWYKSESYGGLWHQVVFVRPFDENTPKIRKNRNKERKTKSFEIPPEYTEFFDSATEEQKEFFITELQNLLKKLRRQDGHQPK